MIRRVKRLMERLKAGKSLATAGVASGGGVLDHALHAGLRKAGIKAHLHAFNEIREDLTEQALEHNELLNDSTIVLNLPLQELAFDEMVMDRIGEVDVVCMGLPCSGASKRAEQSDVQICLKRTRRSGIWSQAQLRCWPS